LSFFIEREKERRKDTISAEKKNVIYLAQTENHPGRGGEKKKGPCQGSSEERGRRGESFSIDTEKGKKGNAL